MITKFTGQDGCGHLISSIRKAYHTKKHNKTEILKLKYMEFFLKKITIYGQNHIKICR